MAVSTTSLDVVKGVCRRDLEVDKSVLPLCRVCNVLDKVVQLANRSLAAPSHELYYVGRDFELACKVDFKSLYVGAEEDLVSHKVNNVPHTQDVALTGVETKLLC